MTGIEASIFNMATDLDKTLIDSTNYMCSERCPCYAADMDSKAFKVYNSYDEKTLNKYGRTKFPMIIETEETVREKYEKEYKKKAL